MIRHCTCTKIVYTHVHVRISFSLSLLHIQYMYMYMCTHVSMHTDTPFSPYRPWLYVPEWMHLCIWVHVHVSLVHKSFFQDSRENEPRFSFLTWFLQFLRWSWHCRKSFHLTVPWIFQTRNRSWLYYCVLQTDTTI